MNKNLLHIASQFSEKEKKTRQRKRVFSLLSIAVVFFTLNALMLPAITIEKQTICGNVEHIHSDECYSDVTTPEYLALSEYHQHGKECYVDGVLLCNNLSTCLHRHNEYCYDSTEVLVCPLEEITGHIHSEECYELQKNLICELAEDYHIHDDSCFVTENGELICSVEETEGHLHTDECYHIISTDLICQIEETEGHIHSEECYRISTENICRLVETEGHKHTEQCKSIENILNCEIAEDENHTHIEECYTANEILICTLEETEPHTHTEQCTRQFKELVCEKEEIPAHTHSTECYQDNKELICGNEEIQPHTHNTECYRQIKTVICEKEEKPDGHFHTERCYEETKNLVCTEKEIILHSHTAECYSENGELTCGLEEVKEHIHSENCTKFVQQEEKTLVCTIEEHTHTDECYPPETDDGRQLVCIREEHVHTESCGDTCEIQEHLHTEDCYIAADIEKEDGTTEDIPPLDIDLYDISNGPVFIVTAKERIVAETEMPEIIPRMKFSARTTFAETVSEENIEELTDYLKDHNGALRLLLETADGTEVPKENGNYVVNTTDIYTLKVNIDIPDGILPGRYRYKLPDGITLDGGAGSLTALVDNRYVVLGEWEINENNGYIVLNFFEEANNYTHVIISAYMAISFSADKEAIDFDGLIKVDIIPPPHVKQPTEVEKGPVSSTTDEIKWRVTIKGNKDSNIPGNILIDGIVTDNHSYTDKDMKNGIKIGISQPDENGNIVDYHSWKVYPGDPNLVWNSKEWHYTIPEICVDCKKPLGNENWIYYVEYTSTPQTTEINGILHYQNMVSVDGSSKYGDAYFNQHTHRAVIMKNGEFVSSGEEGGYNWDVIVTIPGIEPGKKADYGWFVQDEMKIVNGWDWENGIYINNGITKPTVTAFYKGEEITVQPYTKDVRDEPFVYSVGYPGTGDINPKVPEIYFLCKCNCNENNCLLWGSECGIDKDYNPSYCRCWTEEEDVTFTFSYRTTEKDKESLFSDWGGQDYYIQNVARLANFDPIAWVAYPPITDDNDRLFIPGIFKKELHKNFDGYTANYIITVNEAKLNLTNGAPLKIHDAMTDTLAYVNGSLFITAEDINGKVTTLTEGLDYSVIYDGSGNHVAANGDKKHVLDITIYNPQAVKYTLDYDATLIFPDDDTDKVLYSNSAIIELWGDDITSGTDEVTFTKIDMSAQTYSVKIVKSSASTNELLQGARFGLYNQNGGLMAVKSTDEKGEILFKTDVAERVVLSEHQLYYIQEIESPEGYMLDDTKHWFCFCKCEGECEFKPEVDFTFDRVPENQMAYNLRNSTYGYELPRTGGGGTQYYTTGGLVLIIRATVLLLYRSKKCRKEDYTSP